MTESALVKRILKELKTFGAVAVKFHGNAYTKAGTPDILGCYMGRSFSIECKVGDNMPTAIQKHRIGEWAQAGAIVRVAREDFDVRKFMLLMTTHLIVKGK